MEVGGQRQAAAAWFPLNKTLPVLHEAGYPLGPVWATAEYLAHARIGSPDIPARIKSLYLLS